MLFRSLPCPSPAPGPSKDIPGLISIRMDWLDLLAVQGTLKSLLQHHTAQKHQFFGAQLSSQSNSLKRITPVPWHCLFKKASSHWARRQLARKAVRRQDLEELPAKQRMPGAVFADNMQHRAAPPECSS